MGLTFFLTAALLGFLLSRRADLPARGAGLDDPRMGGDGLRRF